MGRKRDVWRRSIGAGFLAASVGMLLAGQTGLTTNLSVVGWTVFWLVCLGFACLAILVALLDLRVISARGREEQRRLFEETLGNIRLRKREERQDPPRSPE